MWMLLQFTIALNRYLFKDLFLVVVVVVVVKRCCTQSLSIGLWLHRFAQWWFHLMFQHLVFESQCIDYNTLWMGMDMCICADDEATPLKIIYWNSREIRFANTYNAIACRHLHLNKNRCENGKCDATKMRQKLCN